MDRTTHPDPLLERVIDLHAAASLRLPRAWQEPAPSDTLRDQVRGEIRATVCAGPRELYKVLLAIESALDGEQAREAIALSNDLATGIRKRCGASASQLLDALHGRESAPGRDLLAVVDDLARLYEYLTYARLVATAAELECASAVRRWSGPTPWRPQAAS
jgi:hypothetical protein